MLDKDKHELLKDVCSFANADGGDLVYGVEDSKGKASKLVPVPSGEMPDAAELRLRQVLDAGLDPRVPGVRFHCVNVAGGYVLIIRVPTSFQGPHCVRNPNNQRRFVIRNGTGTSDMSYDQIRSAFDRTATLVQRAESFIDDRVRRIIDGKIQIPLSKTPIAAVHVVPLAGLAGRQSLDIGAVCDGAYEDFSPFGDVDPRIDGFATSRTHFARVPNLEGLLVFRSVDRDQLFKKGYTQIFRTGATESAHVVRIYTGNHEGYDEQYINSGDLVGDLYDISKRVIASLGKFGCLGPLILKLSLLYLSEFKLDRHASGREIPTAPADREHLALPATWMENVDPMGFDANVRPLFDILWNAFGEVRCPFFDANTGKFVRPER